MTVAARAVSSRNLLRFAAGVVLVLLVIETAYLVSVVIPANWSLGQDFRYYANVGAQWLADGSYYLPRQLEWPYVARLMEDVLYPPNALYLFVPAAVLPWIAWWAVPIAVTLYVLWSWKPQPWAVFVMLALLMWPRAIGAYLFGNTDMWAVAGVAAGLRWGWPAVLLVLKPTFAPFALLGVRQRSWWVGLILLGLVSALQLPLWFDYFTAMRNITISGDYSLGSLPLLAVPIVGYLGGNGAHHRIAHWRDHRTGGRDMAGARVGG
jgi:hypothetical protein